MIEPLKKILLNSAPSDFANFDATLAQVKCDSNMEPVLRSLSFACCKAAARHKGLRVYSFLSQLAGDTELCIAQPIVTLLVLTNDNDHLVSLQALASHAMSIEAALETIRAAAEAIRRHIPKLKDPIKGIKYGAPCIAHMSTEDALRFIVGALKEAQLLDSGLALFVDCHSARRLSQDRETLLYSADKSSEPPLTGSDLSTFAYNLWKDFEVVSLEDPMLFSDPSTNALLTVRY